MLFRHLPYKKTLAHSPSALSKPTLLFPNCTFSSVPNSLNLHSIIQLPNYTQQTNFSWVTTFIFVTLPFVQRTHVRPYIHHLSIGRTPISKLTYNSLTSHSNIAIPPLFNPRLLDIHPEIEPCPISFHFMAPWVPYNSIHEKCVSQIP